MIFFFSSRRRHTRSLCDWSSDVCSSDLLGYFMTNDLFGVLAHTPGRTLFLCWLFGALWGMGCLTAGLAIRFLGMSLGQGVALGFCAAFGTLIPPLFKGQLAVIFASTAGRVVL